MEISHGNNQKITYDEVFSEASLLEDADVCSDLEHIGEERVSECVSA